MNVAAAISWSAKRHADRTAFRFDGRDYSYSEIYSKALRVAGMLRSRGVEKGDRVGVLVGNRPEYAVVEFGIVLLGAVRVPMLVRASAEELSHYISHSDAATVIVSPEGTEMLGQALDHLEADVDVIAMRTASGDPGSAEPRESWASFEELVESAVPLDGPVDLRPEDPMVIRYTGGTTGLPKGLLMSHRNWLTATIINPLLAWDIRRDDVMLHVHPLSHATGFLMYALWIRGAKQVVKPLFNFDPEEFCSTIEQERISVTFLIPTVLNIVLDNAETERFNLSTLRLVIYGGAPIMVDRLREAITRFGPVFSQVYGSSETPFGVAVMDPEEHVLRGNEVPKHLSGAGKLAFNVEVRVVRDSGDDCEVGEVGEIISRGDHTLVRYWKDDALTSERIGDDGWTWTRDMGYFDEEGYLYISDRKDDMIISGGFNIWPAEVENVLFEHPGVRDAAVFGVAHRTWGESVASVVCLLPGTEITEAELQSFLRERLASYKVPKRIVFRQAELPRSAVDKTLRRKVRDEHLAEFMEVPELTN